MISCDVYCLSSVPWLLSIQFILSITLQHSSYHQPGSREGDLTICVAVWWRSSREPAINGGAIKCSLVRPGLCSVTSNTSSPHLVTNGQTRSSADLNTPPRMCGSRRWECVPGVPSWQYFLQLVIRFTRAPSQTSFISPRYWKQWRPGWRQLVYWL